MRIFFPFLGVAVSAALVACQIPANAAQCDNVDRTLFNGEPLAVRMQRFSSLPLETQYAVFICGNQKTHPPATYFAAPLASRGPEARDFLLNKLKADVDDLTVRDIVLIFSEMNRTGSYAVTKDLQTLNVLDEKIKHMKNIELQSLTQNMLHEIEVGR
jgi:hypothetical protein